MVEQPVAVCLATIGQLTRAEIEMYTNMRQRGEKSASRGDAIALSRHVRGIDNCCQCSGNATALSGWLSPPQITALT